MVDVQFGAQRVNLLGLIEGDGWSVPITITSGGLPFNLTGATITSAMNIGGVFFPITVLVTDAINGKLTISQASAPLINCEGSWYLRVDTRTFLAGYCSRFLIHYRLTESVISLGRCDIPETKNAPLLAGRFSR